MQNDSIFLPRNGATTSSNITISQRLNCNNFSVKKLESFKGTADIVIFNHMFSYRVFYVERRLLILESLAKIIHTHTLTHKKTHAVMYTYFNCNFPQEDILNNQKIQITVENPL